ncbi:MAG: exodeoxyribonuclease III [Bacteroidales bacterium]|nr:exodeoxyribonuclease III [Bacteroidales bacterium]
MKLISWNVNGLRAVCQKGGFDEIFNSLDADIFCLQETKLQQGQIDIAFPGYQSFWSYANKKGYSGTAVFTRVQPLRRVDVPVLDSEVFPGNEGRLVVLEFEDFFLINCYTPNSQDELKRLDFRMRWEDYLRSYLIELDQQKPIIYCGDLNVAHNEIDLKNPKTNHLNAGFSDQERSKMTELLSSGFIDTFRMFNPDLEGAYTWWSYRFQARAKNAGWRIDYFICSNRLQSRIRQSTIHNEIYGSDHCPIELVLD